MIETTLIRNEIKRLRIEKGISTEEMAEKLLMDKRNYERIENGERKTLDIKLADEIANILGAELADWIKLASSITINADHDNHIVGIASKDVIMQSGNKEEVATLKQVLDEKSALIAAQKEIIEQQKAFIDRLMNQGAQ